jgi:uncharacterized protein YbjT (DUF2867 family)
MRVLVAGDGAVAEATVSALLERRHEVRLLSPRAETVVRRWPQGVEARVAGPASARRPEGAAEGCDAVLQLAALRAPWPRKVDLRGTRGLAAEAQRAGAARFVLLSSLHHERGTSEEDRTLQQIEDIARGYRGVWSIVRAGMMYAPGEGGLDALATMVRTLPAVPVVDGGRIELQPLWHEDLGRALARAAEAPQAAGQVLHVAGPERARLSDVLDRLCVLIGRHPARVPVPRVLAAAGAEAATLLGLRLPARAAALAELDEDAVLPPSIENALTSVLGVAPTLLDEGLRKLVADVPEQTPAAAAAALRRQTFQVEIHGSHRTARELRDAFRRRARHVLDLEDGPPEGQPIKKGTLVSARVPLRGLIELRIAEVVPEGLTAVTVEGDPLAGLVTFRFRDVDHAVHVQIVVEAAPASLVDRLVARATGGMLEDLDWTSALDRMVELSGGRAPAGVQRDVETLDEEEAARVRERAERLRVIRQRESAPATRPRTASSGITPRTLRPPAAARPRARRRSPATRAPRPPRAARTRRPA